MTTSSSGEPTAPRAVTGTGRDLYRLLVASLQDYAVFALDATGHVMTWNPGAQRFKGYEADEIIGRHFSVFYPPERIAEGFPAFELEVASRDGRFEEEGWRLRKDGSRFWANVVITALRDERGQLVGFAKVTRDLTERRAAASEALAVATRLAAEEAARSAAEARAEELRRLAAQLQDRTAELEQQRRRAETANRAKGEFLAAMSHELRTPLNAIGGYADLLAMGVRGALTPEQQADVERIRRSQQHLLGVINDILNFSRVEAGRVTYDLAPLSMRVAIAGIEPMIAPQAEARSIRFTSAPCVGDVAAIADQMKVEQILLNLLSNAVKFTEPGGEVTLVCEARGDAVVVHVRDTGIGLPAEKLDSIFEPFVQVGRSLTRPTEGTGLGLAISRDLARGMHGELTVESVEGAGSTFTLTLPRAGTYAL